MHVAHVMRWPKTSSGSLLEISFGDNVENLWWKLDTKRSFSVTNHD